MDASSEKGWLEPIIGKGLQFPRESSENADLPFQSSNNFIAKERFEYQPLKVNCFNSRQHIKMIYLKERLLSQDRIAWSNIKNNSLLEVRKALNLHYSQL